MDDQAKKELRHLRRQMDVTFRVDIADAREILRWFTGSLNLGDNEEGPFYDAEIVRVEEVKP